MAVPYGDDLKVLEAELGRDSGLFLCTALTEQGMAVADPVEGKASIEYDILCILLQYLDDEWKRVRGIFDDDAASFTRWAKSAT